MTQTLHFNTGRQYTAAGQRITATLHENQVVTFFDHDRNVDGEFKLYGDFTKQAILHAYDNNVAKQTKRSWEDGMMMGGCNTVWVEETKIA